MKIQTKKQTVIARNIPPMRFIIAMFLSALLLAACGDDSENAGGTVEDGEVVAIVDKMISGVSQKGPFVNGSSVTVQELDGKTLAQTGLGFEGKIKNDLGEFTVKVNKLESQYALLKANGFYRNEVTGEKSKSQITLYALTDLSNRDEVNVNLLTHLAYERSLYLATGKDSMSIASAKKQAESEVFKSFGIEGNFATAEDLNIFGESDQSAALLAVSILMQSDLSEGDFSERLADYAADMEADGVWNDSKTATKIADWANTQWLGSGLTKIRENITKWELSTDVPEFEKYVNNFWWQNYGLGTCDKKREGEVLKNQNKASVNADEYYICKSKSWQVASDIEKDTYKWLDPTAKRTEKDGDVRYGDVVKTNCYVFENKTWRSGNANDCSLDLRGCTNLRQDTVGKGSDKVWYICDAKTWREATDIEKDTYKWEPGKDADVKNGDVVKKNCYVFEDGAWRSGNEKDCSLKLRGCTALRQDTVGKGSDEVWYICDQKNWRKALALEYDTYQVECSRDGKMLNGNINVSSKYVCDDGIYRTADTLEIWADTACTSYNRDSMYVLPFVAKGKYQQGDKEPILIGLEKVVNYSYYKCTKNGWILTTEKLNQGTMVDERDGHVYQTIGIKSQMWMAENLNYADSVNYPSMLGRNWCLDDKDSCARYGRRYTWSAAIDSAYWSEQGITCGYGEPFCNLPNKVQGICPEGWHIPKKSEYIPHAECSTNCSGKIVSSDDEYGFSPILSVGVYRDGDFDLNLDNAYFWSANDEGASYAYCWSVFPRDGAITGQKNEGISVRCVKDEE